MSNLPALQQKAVTLRDYLGKKVVRDTLSEALPKWLSIDRLLRIVFTSTMKNPQLLDCTKESLLQSIMQCAQLGLEPILGRAYLIPYKNSKQINGKWEKVLECQFQPGYQGIVDLARRSGEVKDVFAMVVYENDDFDLEYGTNRRLTHKPFLGEDPGEPIGAYTVWELSDGTKTFEFMPLHEIYKRRDKSQAYQYAIKNPTNKNAQDCPWIQWPEEQMKKTVVKHHAKLQPASIEVMQAVELDDAATLGRSQLGMFADIPNYSALMPPESEPETYDTTKFDRLAKNKIDYPDSTVDKFLALTAQAQAVSIDKLKVVASEDFESFWGAFEAWRLKTYPGQTEDLEQTYKCPWPNCDFSTPSEKGYKTHITRSHDGKEKPDDTPSETENAQGSQDDAGEDDEKPLFDRDAPPFGDPPPEKKNGNSDYIACPTQHRRIHNAVCTKNCNTKDRCDPYKEFIHNREQY